MEQPTRSRDGSVTLCELITGRAMPQYERARGRDGYATLNAAGKLGLYLLRKAKMVGTAGAGEHAAAMTASRVKHPTYSRSTLHRARIAILRDGTIVDQNASLDAGEPDGEGRYELRLRTVRFQSSGDGGKVDFPSSPLDQPAVNRIQEILGGDRLHGLGFKFSLDMG